MLVLPTFFDAVFDGTGMGWARPAVPISGTFGFTDDSYFFGKSDIVGIEKGIHKHRVVFYDVLNYLFVTLVCHAFLI